MQPQPAPRATAADLEHLERHEVVDGQLVQKAAPSFEHGGVQAGIVIGLAGFRGGGRDGENADRPGGWWIGTEVEVELASHQVYLPDVAGWRIDRVPTRPSGRPITTPPDWVCEVLSPSTAARDLGVKQRNYHTAHVSHFWVIDPIDGVLTVYRWTEPGYVLALAAGAEERVRAEPFDAVELDLGLVFGGG